MVYLLKWLISLITPHTHDKEGKQGNSFIVRKALGNRASFSSLASKKGSSLLLVVMTMSVIIVISSSFMLFDKQPQPIESITANTRKVHMK